MQNHGYKPEHYPIIVQVIPKNGVEYLSAFQPDFNYRVMEVFNAKDVGQTEMMILKMRREIASRIARSKDSPTPAKSAALYKVPERESISTKDAARILNVSEMTVRRMADDGSLKILKKTRGGHRRFSPSEIELFLVQQNPLLNLETNTLEKFSDDTI